MPHVKLLLDENLSPAVAVALCCDGVDAAHVRDRGLTGATDPEVLASAYHEDRVLVTANVADFHALARAADLHAGIVFVEDGELMRGEQTELMRRVVAAIEAEHEAGRDKVNRVMRIGRSTDRHSRTCPERVQTGYKNSTRFPVGGTGTPLQPFEFA